MSERVPDPSAVRDALARILSSRCFEKSQRHKAFLEFVVGETLAGRGDRLKGYTIAVEVFERPDDFDPQTDPLVRVEAGRLRRRLMEYYATEGSEDPVRIELQRGVYSVTASFHPDVATQVEPADHSRGRRWALRGAAIASVAIAVAFAAWIGVERLLPATAPDAQPAARTETHAGVPDDAADGPARVFVVPFTDLSVGGEFTYFSYGVGEELILRLRELGLFVVKSFLPLTGNDPAALESILRGNGDVDYVLTGAIRSTDGRVRITARLVEASNGTQLWAESFEEDLSLGTLLDIEQRIARDVVESVALPFGPIFDRETELTYRKPPERLDSYDCLLRYYFYRRTFDEATHGDALDCFSAAVEREPGYAGAHAGLALLWLDEYLWHSPPSVDAGLLDRAREAAATALDIDGDDAFAHFAMARQRFLSDDMEAFERGLPRALELGRHDPDILVTIASYLMLAGQPERGLPLAERALSLSSNPPGSYYLVFALDRLRARDGAAALDFALRMDTPSWYVSEMLVAAAAGLAGEDDIASRAMGNLLGLEPVVLDRLDEMFGQFNVDDELQGALRDGLRLAGGGALRAE